MSNTTNPDLATRAKTAVVLIVLFVLAAGFGIYSDTGRKVFTSLIFILISIASFEISRFPQGQTNTVFFSRWALLVLPSFVVICFGLFCPLFSGPILMAVILASVVFIQALSLSILCMCASQQSFLDDLLKSFGLDQLGFFLLGLGGASAIGLALFSPVMALGLVAVVAVADSVAYFAGRSFGDRKIAPLVSPKKTLVGTVAGILLGGTLGMILLLAYPENYFLAWPAALLLSFAIVICSQSGDYAKSIVKRRYDIKDFGKIFPGHGGALDRLDGILGAAPLALVIAVLVCNR